GEPGNEAVLAGLRKAVMVAKERDPQGKALKVLEQAEQLKEEVGKERKALVGKLREAQVLGRDDEDAAKGIDNLLKARSDLADKLVQARAMEKGGDPAKGIDKLLAERKEGEKKVQELEGQVEAGKQAVANLTKTLKERPSAVQLLPVWAAALREGGD